MSYVKRIQKKDNKLYIMSLKNYITIKCVWLRIWFKARVSFSISVSVHSVAKTKYC